MTKRVIIVGIPGVGKSTVITKVFEILSQQGIDTRIAEFGKIMFEQAKQLEINNRDQLRKLPIDEQRTLQELTAKFINSLGNDIVIIDTHLLISTEHGFYPGLPMKLLNILNPTHIVLVTASSEEIFNRRSRDNTRQRDLVSIEQIKNDLRMSENMISMSSIITGSPFYLIHNNTDQIEAASNSIVKVILGR
jgi:adenylate kinase